MKLQDALNELKHCKAWTHDESGHRQIPEFVENAIDIAIDAIGGAVKPHGSYECFHCGAQDVIWDSDFTFEDYGIDGEGIIHNCHCTNCGAEIEYYIRCDEEENGDE